MDLHANPQQLWGKKMNELPITDYELINLQSDSEQLGKTK
jgi:hypothetical protein